MKAVRLLLAMLASVIVVNLAIITTVQAEQGYARIEFVASKTEVYVGEEFTVAVYIVGLNNTEYGKSLFVSDYWHPNDLNPRGYEFVRFDSAGSDFPISISQNVRAGSFGYQCRYFERQAPTDMTGRHLFGRFVYRAVNEGTYGLSTHHPCDTRIESLGTRWGGIIWDYANVSFAVNNLSSAQPATPNTPHTSSSAATESTSPEGATSQKKKTTNNEASGPAALENTGAGVLSAQATAKDPVDQDAQSTTNQSSSKPTASQNPTSSKWIWFALIPAALLPPVIWKIWKLRKNKNSETSK